MTTPSAAIVAATDFCEPACHAAAEHAAWPGRTTRPVVAGGGADVPVSARPGSDR